MYFHVLLMLSNNFTLNFAKNSCAKLALFSFTILTVLVNRILMRGPVRPTINVMQVKITGGIKFQN